MSSMDTWSIVLNSTTGLLFIISELLALSKCDSNGIFHFLINNIPCLKSAGIKEVEVLVKVCCSF